ncbi:GtrA family protein [Paenibacillus sp.]|uniref:GtrA family protein n=1 Tax=Paenibacillus sp. TaxID=58172 RepID=UPI0035C79D65
MHARYIRFLFIGSSLAISTILIRELLAFFIPSYLISVILSYGISIVLSFVTHKKFTYKSEQTFHYISFIKYVLIALLGLLTTSVFSLLLSNWGILSLLFQNFDKTVAFAASLFLASLLTYWLNGVMVFNNSKEK